MREGFLPRGTGLLGPAGVTCPGGGAAAHRGGERRAAGALLACGAFVGTFLGGDLSARCGVV